METKDLLVLGGIGALVYFLTKDKQGAGQVAVSPGVLGFGMGLKNSVAPTPALPGTHDTGSVLMGVTSPIIQPVATVSIEPSYVTPLPATVTVAPQPTVVSAPQPSYVPPPPATGTVVTATQQIQAPFLSVNNVRRANVLSAEIGQLQTDNSDGAFILPNMWPLHNGRDEGMVYIDNIPTGQNYLFKFFNPYYPNRMSISIGVINQSQGVGGFIMSVNPAPVIPVIDYNYPAYGDRHIALFNSSIGWWYIMLAIVNGPRSLIVVYETVATGG